MPLREMVQNMQGLAQLAEMRRQAKNQEEDRARQKSGIEALNSYVATEEAGNPDMSLFYKAVTQAPEAASNVLKGIGIDKENKARDASQFILEATPVIDNRDEFLRRVDNRIAMLQQSGRDASDTQALKQQYLSGDIAGAKKNLQGVAAALVGSGYLQPKAYDYAFGPAPGSMDEYQKATIGLRNKELALDQQRLGLEAQRVATGVGQLTADERNWNRYQDLLKTDPKQARQFGIAKGFVTNEGQKLSVFDSKVIDSASTEATTAASAASRYLDIANKLREKNVSGGVFSTWSEAVKDITGNQDEITNLKKTVMEVVNSEAIKSLPPGAASNADVAFAREPFPTGRANGEYVAKWLEAISRLNQKRAEFAEHKARFIGQYGGQRDPETGETVLSSWKKMQAEQPQTENTDQLFKDADAIIGGQ